MRHTLAFAVLATAAAPALADHHAAMPEPGTIQEDGTVIVPSFALPPSDYMSEEAAASLPREPTDQMARMDMLLKAPDPGAVRKMASQYMAPVHAKMKADFGVVTEAGEIAGVPVMYAMPASGVPEGNKTKILIDLPGGGFVAGTADGSGMTESIPLAGMAKVKIVSISYRQYPEYRFPAASEDVEKVYRELLKTYKPEDIGLFGCSAGGALTAQSMAWFLDKDLPLPGAAGIFCASAGRIGGGDSGHYARPFQALPAMDRPLRYFEGADMESALVSPVLHPEVIGQFPPTLIITATRAFEFSSAIDTNNKLAAAGVDTKLHVWDGLEHAFFYNSDLPESREAFAVMDRFFSEHLDLVD